MLKTKTLLATLTLSLIAAAGANAVPIPDDVKIGGFAIGAQAYSFNRYTAVEAVERAAHAGAKVIEFYPGQKFSKDDPSPFDHDHVTPEKIATIKEVLKKNGVRAVNYGVVGISKNENDARKVFEFAKQLELYSITTESTDAIDTIEKLVKEYDICVGYHNHPRQNNNPNYKVWDPNYILELVKNRDKRIGAAADVGHWSTQGTKAVDGLRILKGRIISLHIKDRKEFGKGSTDVALGAGAIGIADVLDELARQNFKGNISIEHETHWENNVPEIAGGIGFVRGYGTAKSQRR